MADGNARCSQQVWQLATQSEKRRQRKKVTNMRALGVRREPAMASQTPSFMQWTTESTRQKTVLVIEPHSVIAELLMYTLKLSEYGGSLLDTMDMTSLTWRENRIDTCPECIIFDVDYRSMTFKNPLEFMHAFCIQWQIAFLSPSMPPLILLTTQSTACTELQGEGYTVVMKPFKPYVLLHLVKAAVERKQEGGKDTNPI